MKSSAITRNKPQLSFWQIWNMSFGFLGIQIGWGLQMGNMSAIYEMLDAEPDQIPLLFLAAPLTGLIIQPIVGFLSDNTWSKKFGRRKPYFLIGALLASIALILMPYSSGIWMAAGMLWVLDASINISMEPKRALIADLLPENQLQKGYSMQSLFIGIGAVIAAVIPFLLTEKMDLAKTSADGTIPAFLKLTFLIGAICFFLAVLYTVLTTKEYPPEFYAEEDEEKMGYFDGLKHAFKNMPKSFVRLAPVQFFTWMGLFLMWFYLTPTICRHVMGAENAQSSLYADGVVWANICNGYYALITFLFAIIMPKIAEKIGVTRLHAFALLTGAISLLSIYFIHDKMILLIPMTGIGIAWASIVATPYTLIAKDIPQKQMGIFMGLFNMFIVIPEIIASLGFGWFMKNVLHNSHVNALVVGGCLLTIAALLTFGLKRTFENA